MSARLRDFFGWVAFWLVMGVVFLFAAWVGDQWAPEPVAEPCRLIFHGQHYEFGGVVNSCVTP